MTREDNLLKKIENGDRQALDALITAYYPDILRYCLWHTKDRAAAEDATQETFLKAVRFWDHYRHQGHFRAWLYKIAANVCRDAWRKTVEEPLPEDMAYDEAGFGRAESDADFIRMVADLPNEARELVLLRFAQDLTLREIAVVTGLPMRTVQSRLRAALKKIKKQLLKGES